MLAAPKNIGDDIAKALLIQPNSSSLGQATGSNTQQIGGRCELARGEAESGAEADDNLDTILGQNRRRASTSTSTREISS